MHRRFLKGDIMQLVQVQSPKSLGAPIAGLFAASLLWLALGAAGICLAAGVAIVPRSGPSSTIAMLTLFVAAVVATFSLRYMRADRRSDRFFLLLAALVGSVLAFLSAGNVAVLAAAWCMSGWLLAALIGHCDDVPEARAAMLRARRSFVVGDAALLAALAILALHAGSLRIGAITDAAATMPAMVATSAAVLLVIAAAARCALPPFSGWLLFSMTAPTPVSALMHAGLVNAGGFLLIQFAPVLEAAPAARIVAVAAGLCGAVYGIGIMLIRPDVKRSLAGSTVSQMGFMLMSCGLGAYGAALWHIVAHGLFKAWLFLGSGSTIGMKTAPRAAPLSAMESLAIAAATTGIALAIVVSGDGDAALVPLLLGLATAAAALVAALRGTAKAQAKVSFAVGVVVLIGLHGAGLSLATAATGPNAPAIVPDAALIALLIVFLGGWVWQQQSLARGTGLPLGLYVRLINAGALCPAGKGERA